MKCSCGCNLSPFMVRVLRELAVYAEPDPIAAHDVYEIARHMVPRVSGRGVRSALHALRRRGYAARLFTSPVEWRITSEGLLWCKEHRE